MAAGSIHNFLPVFESVFPGRSSKCNVSLSIRESAET